MKKGFVLFLSILLIILSTLSFSYTTLNNFDQKCYPGCLINFTINLSEDINKLNITSNRIIESIEYIENNSYKSFSNNQYNFSRYKNYTFILEINNLVNTNFTLEVNISNSTNIKENYTNDINLDYFIYKNKKNDNTINNIYFEQNKIRINNIEKTLKNVDMIIQKNTILIDDNQSSLYSLRVKNLNISNIRFNQVINLNSKDLTLANAHSELPINIKSTYKFNNPNIVFDNSDFDIEIQINTNGENYKIYEINGGSASEVINTVGQENKIISSASFINVKSKLNKELILGIVDGTPIIEDVILSDKTVHLGQKINITIILDDEDTKKVYVNNNELNKNSKYNWSDEITISEEIIKIFVEDKNNNVLYEEYANISIESVAPIIKILSPQYKTYETSNLDLSYKINDENIKENKINFNDNEKNSIINDEGVIPLNNLRFGTHYAKITSTDTHENVREKKVIFKIKVPKSNNIDFLDNFFNINFYDFVILTNQTKTYFNNVTNKTNLILNNQTINNFRQFVPLENINYFSLKDKEGSTTIGEFEDLNKEMTLNINKKIKNNIENKYEDIDFNFNFEGIDANWNNSFEILDNSTKENQKLGSYKDNTIINIHLNNINHFFPDEKYEGSMELPFDLSNKKILVKEIDSNKLNIIKNERIIQNQVKTIIDIKNLESIIILENTNKILLEYLNLGRDSTINNMDFNISLKLQTLSNYSSCNYLLKNFKTYNPVRISKTLEVDNNFTQELNLSFKNIPDDYYKLSLNCSNTHNYGIEEGFFVKDTTMPEITKIIHVSTDTASPYEFFDTTSLSLDKPRISILTNEQSNCYISKSLIKLDSMNKFDETNSKLHKTDLFLENNNNTIYIICEDLNENAMITPLVVNYFIKSRYTEPNPSIPIVGKGSEFNTIKDINHEISWQYAKKNTILNINFDEEDQSFEKIKLTVNSDLENVLIKLNQSRNISNRSYAMISFNLDNFDNSQISKRQIQFKVKNEYIQNHEISKDEIVLLEKTSEGKMKRTPTFVLRSNEKYTYYQSITNQLIEYQISIQEKEKSSSNLIKDIDISNKTVVEEEKVNNDQDDELIIEISNDKNKNLIKVIVYLLMGLIIVLLLVNIKSNSKGKAYKNLNDDYKRLKELKNEINHKK